MAEEASAAVSGGLLVLLGIIVAVGLGVFFFQDKIGGSSGPSVSVTLPKE